MRVGEKTGSSDRGPIWCGSRKPPEAWEELECCLPDGKDAGHVVATGVFWQQRAPGARGAQTEPRKGAARPPALGSWGPVSRLREEARGGQRSWGQIWDPWACQQGENSGESRRGDGQTPGLRPPGREAGLCSFLPSQHLSQGPTSWRGLGPPLHRCRVVRRQGSPAWLSGAWEGGGLVQ